MKALTLAIFLEAAYQIGGRPIPRRFWFRSIEALLPYVRTAQPTHQPTTEEPTP